MTIREIVTVPDPVLRRKTQKVTQFDEKLQTLVDDMIETMRAAPGVGLAAPQIGVLEQVIVVEYFENEEDEEDADIADARESIPPYRPASLRMAVVFPEPEGPITAVKDPASMVRSTPSSARTCMAPVP